MPAAPEPSKPQDLMRLPGGEPQHARPQLPSRPTAETSPALPPATPAVSAPSAHDLIERGKADIETDSRRRMLDPMFAPPAPHRPPASALERATARHEARVEMIRDDTLRHTNADGRSYCLQKPPDAATRDGPVAITLVPMYCP